MSDGQPTKLKGIFAAKFPSSSVCLFFIFVLQRKPGLSKADYFLWRG